MKFALLRANPTFPVPPSRVQTLGAQSPMNMGSPFKSPGPKQMETLVQFPDPANLSNEVNELDQLVLENQQMPNPMNEQVEKAIKK